MQNGSAKEGSKIFNNSETRPFLMLFLEEKHLSMFGKHAQSCSFLVTGGRKVNRKKAETCEAAASMFNNFKVIRISHLIVGKCETAPRYLNLQNPKSE